MKRGCSSVLLAPIESVEKMETETGHQARFSSTQSYRRGVLRRRNSYIATTDGGGVNTNGDGDGPLDSSATNSLPPRMFTLNEQQRRFRTSVSPSSCARSLLQMELYSATRSGDGGIPPLPFTFAGARR